MCEDLLIMVEIGECFQRKFLGLDILITAKLVEGSLCILEEWLSAIGEAQVKVILPIRAESFTHNKCHMTWLVISYQKHLLTRFSQHFKHLSYLWLLLDELNSIKFVVR